ncbi:DUF4331 family protein [Actinacidiphila sp. ITFR-21]|uniref:DUF4331 family protein n=1 Tax=Actinacidiphila sp. ITFR-21 TaxID=3075199 RepID=UPI0028894A56|nr:DUF4331 family protein [Streptomyces sp. ITFR-21]WNI14773.1 DUF4331 family protein [Streptomyces sp. ITFR-21]
MTLIANWYPFQEPNGGPDFYPFTTDAHYDINIDSQGTGTPDLVHPGSPGPHHRGRAGAAAGAGGRRQPGRPGALPALPGRTRLQHRPSPAGPGPLPQRAPPRSDLHRLGGRVGPRRGRPRPDPPRGGRLPDGRRPGAAAAARTGVRRAAGVLGRAREAAAQYGVLEAEQRLFAADARSRLTAVRGRR